MYFVFHVYSNPTLQNYKTMVSSETEPLIFFITE